jgi:hypothetical protein
MGLSLLPDDLDACRLRLTRRRVNWRFLAACSAQNDMQGHVALKTGDWTLHSTGKAVVAASRCDGAETRMPGTWYAVMQAADWAGGVRAGRGQKDVGVARPQLCHSLGHLAGPLRNGGRKRLRAYS